MKFFKKKSVWVILGLILLLVVSGCGGKDPREEMTQSLSKYTNKQEAAGKFEMKIKKLETSNTSSTTTTSSAYTSAIVKQMKDAKLSGDYNTNGKTTEINLKLQAMGMEVPVTVVGDKKNAYISTDFISTVYKFVAKMNQGVTLDQTELAKLDGKFISAQDAAKQSSNGQITAKKGDQKAAADFFKDFQKELKKYVKKLDKKTFKTDGDVITHTFTKSEIIDLSKLMEKTAGSKKEYADIKKGLSSKDVKKQLESFKKFTIKLSVNKKTNKINMLYTVEPKEDNSIKSLVLTFTITPGKYKSAPELPDAANILTSEKVQTILQAATGQTQTQAQTQTQTKISDQQFKQLLNQIKKAKASGQTITEAKKTQFLQTYKSYLTDKQYKQLKKELDK